MYLGMTEKEYKMVILETPKAVAFRMGIKESLISLDEAIKSKDKIAYEIMQDFLNTYKLWWDLSNEIMTIKNSVLLQTKRKELGNVILKRNEIRKSMISYLNYKYGILNEQS